MNQHVPSNEKAKKGGFLVPLLVTLGLSALIFSREPERFDPTVSVESGAGSALRRLITLVEAQPGHNYGNGHLSVGYDKSGNLFVSDQWGSNDDMSGGHERAVVANNGVVLKFERSSHEEHSNDNSPVTFINVRYWIADDGKAVPVYADYRNAKYPNPFDGKSESEKQEIITRMVRDFVGKSAHQVPDLSIP